MNDFDDFLQKNGELRGLFLDKNERLSDSTTKFYHILNYVFWRFTLNQKNFKTRVPAILKWLVFKKFKNAILMNFCMFKWILTILIFQNFKIQKF